MLKEIPLLREMNSAFGFWGYLFLGAFAIWIFWRYLGYIKFKKLTDKAKLKLNSLGRELPTELRNILISLRLGLAAELFTLIIFVTFWTIKEHAVALILTPILIANLDRLFKKSRTALNAADLAMSQSSFFDSSTIASLSLADESKDLAGKLEKLLASKKEKEKKSAHRKQAEQITLDILACMEAMGDIQAFDLIDEIYFCKTGVLEELCENATQELLAQKTRKQSDGIKIEGLVKILKEKTPLKKEAAFNLIIGYFTQGSIYIRKGEFFFYTDSQAENIALCECCGQVTDIELQIESEGEIFCSNVCESIYHQLTTQEFKPSEKFEIACKSINYGINANIAGTAGAQYAENQKLFSIGGQGHGFIAEKSNTYYDRLKGKDAVILGDDNAKSGPDRLVDGQLLQTKYCKTAARSVGAMFDGQDGSWKYTYKDENGLLKIMPVEVPKDQYEPAIKELKKKIAAGRVPGITSQDGAEKLVIKGAISYEQAKSVARFGTIESLTFDAYEGVTASTEACSISFLVNFSQTYWRTQDPKKACEAAIASTVATLSKQTATMILVQQLHRLESVQSLVSSVSIPESMHSFFAKSLNVNNAQASRALGGVLIANAVVISLAASKDIYHLINNKISGQQLLKNTAITASGVAGGTAGAMAGSVFAGKLVGGSLGSLAGPVGSFLGAALVGHLATMATQSLLDKHIENDRAKIDRLVRFQIKHLANKYLMSPEEVQIVTDNIIETSLNIAPNENSTTIINSILLPHVVYLAKNRPHVSLSEFKRARESLLLQPS